LVLGLASRPHSLQLFSLAPHCRVISIQEGKRGGERGKKDISVSILAVNIGGEKDTICLDIFTLYEHAFLEYAYIEWSLNCLQF
jgi:hypothetical protein